VTTESIEALLKTLAPALTLIVVTHNLGQAMRVSHQTMFFYQGALIEHGPTDDLFNRPSHPDTERYVNGTDGVGGTGLPGGRPVRTHKPHQPVQPEQHQPTHITRREPVTKLMSATRLRVGVIALRRSASR
jgi:ABC-type glutathione transport system ATPase component